MSQDWNTLTKPERETLLKSVGLPAILAQLRWGSLTKTQRSKIEKSSKKGKGWHEQKEDVVTEKGTEQKAPIHRKVALQKVSQEAINEPIQVQEEKKEAPKEWEKPEMPQGWYKVFKLKYDANLKHEAQAFYYEKKIKVGKKFYELPDEKVKKLTIAHEVGHIFEELTRELQLSLAGGQASKILGTTKGDYYDGFMGGYRPSEAYANAVAETYSRAGWMKANHSKIYTLVMETVPSDWKEAIEHFISESERGAESEYRLDKGQEDGDFIASQIKPPYQVIKVDTRSIEYTSPHHEGHLMIQTLNNAEGVQKALEDVTEVIKTIQDVLEKCPHIRSYYKFKLTDLKKDINFNKPYVNLVFGLRPVKEYFGRGSATVGARGIKFWWYNPEDSTKHFKENPYYSIEATPPATIAHEIAHTLGSDNEFIDPLATLVAFMFYTKHHEYMAENSFEYMSREIGRTTNEIVRGKIKRPAITSEMLEYYYAENQLELAAVVGQYSREDGEKVWAFLAQEKKKTKKPKEKKVFQFTPQSYIEYAKQHPWGMYKIQQIAGTKQIAPEQNIAQINQWMAHNNYDDKLIKEWNKEVKAENRYPASHILNELGIPFGLSEPAHKIFDPKFEEAEAERMKAEEEPDWRKYSDPDADKTEELSDDPTARYSFYSEPNLLSPEEEDFNDLFAEAVFTGAINTEPGYNKLTDPEQIKWRWQRAFYEDPEGTIKELEDLIKKQKPKGREEITVSFDSLTAAPKLKKDLKKLTDEELVDLHKKVKYTSHHDSINQELTSRGYFKKREQQELRAKYASIPKEKLEGLLSFYKNDKDKDSFINEIEVIQEILKK